MEILTQEQADLVLGKSNLKEWKALMSLYFLKAYELPNYAEELGDAYLMEFYEDETLEDAIEEEIENWTDDEEN